MSTTTSSSTTSSSTTTGTNKILVLGATGTIGGLVVKELLEQKLSHSSSILAGVRKSSNESKVTKAFEAQGIEIRLFDWNEKDTWNKALKDVKSLFVLPPWQEDVVNPVKGVVESAKKAGVKHIVMLSAHGADSKSPLHVISQHGKSDDIVKTSGVDSYTILQPTFFTSNLIQDAHSISTQGVIYGSAGDGKTSYITPKDIARVAAHVLTASNPEQHQNKVYPLSGTELLSSAEIASALSLVLQKSIKYVNLSVEEHKSLLIKHGGLKSWQADDVVGLEQIKKTEPAVSLELDSNVKKITGSWPQSFASWIQENKDSFALVVPPLSDSAKKRFVGQLAVVTGGNRGIGLAVVKQLVKLGLRVILTARDEKTGNEVISKLRKEEELDKFKDNVLFHTLDISSESSVNQFKQFLKKQHDGKIDLLINNAGIVSSFDVDFFDTSIAEVAKVFDTNVLGSIRMLHAITDLIKTHNSGNGRIVNISSAAGTFKYQTGAGFPYTNSKLGLNAASQAAALAVSRDEKTKNLHIVSLCPGPVMTDMYYQAASETLREKMLKALTIRTTDQAADDIVSLALSDNFVHFHGKFFQFGKELSYL